MRLINVHDYRLKEFFGEKIPEYAILSHTWGPEEVLFEDILRLHVEDADTDIVNGLTLNRQITRKRGFKKIKYACAQAKRNLLNWVWVDTCCIDKTSSTELGEAINSMFQWYKDARVCYAYLDDLSVPPRHDPAFETMLHAGLPTSRWFTRGWTLQELIAPEVVMFYGIDWSYCGSRRRWSSIISRITGIPKIVLGAWWSTKRKPFKILEPPERSYNGIPFSDFPRSSFMDYSTAQKMSWAAKRHCTRIEDTAYCLFGLFDITMPLLYGERERAFTRLQEEIFSQIDDHSLLAWNYPQAKDSDTPPSIPTSVLAPSPKEFANSARITRFHDELNDPSSITKKGLRISLFISPEDEQPLGLQILLRKYSIWPVTCAVLNCGYVAGDKRYRLLLLLAENETELMKQSPNSQCYIRLATPRHLWVEDSSIFQSSSLYKTIFIRSTRYKYPSHAQLPTEAEQISFYFQNSSPKYPSATDQFIGEKFEYKLERTSFVTDNLPAHQMNEWRIDRAISTLNNSTSHKHARKLRLIASEHLVYSSRAASVRLRLYLTNENQGSDLEILCSIHRPTAVNRGHFTLEVRPGPTAVSMPQRCSNYVDLHNINGLIGLVGVILDDAYLIIRLEARPAWFYDRRGRLNVTGSRLHFYISLASFPIIPGQHRFAQGGDLIPLPPPIYTSRGPPPPPSPPLPSSPSLLIMRPRERDRERREKERKRERKREERERERERDKRIEDQISQYLLPEPPTTPSRG